MIDAIEDEEFIRDEEIHGGGAKIVGERAGDDWFDIMDKLVADKSHRPAGKARERREGDGAVFLENGLDHFEAVANLAIGAIGLWMDGELLDEFAALDEFDPVAGLADDAVNGGKAEGGPLPYILCSEERLEDTVYDVGRMCRK